MNTGKKTRLAIFASGSGSNANKIIEYFKNHDFIEIALVLFNRKKAGVQQYAIKNQIPAIYCPDKALNQEVIFLASLKPYSIDGIVLAGFLSLIPAYLIQSYPDKILNIHPALLPKFGGEGMYGHHVHDAVSHSGVQVTGLTVHQVNTEYDQGRIIYQCRVPITPYSDPLLIAKSVLYYEHHSYPMIIDHYFRNKS